MNLTDNQEGKYLYKYVPFNLYSLQILINKEFWLGSPDFLNDPFEGDFIIENYEEFHNEDCIEHLIGRYKHSFSNVDYHTIRFGDLIENKNEFLQELYEYLNYHYVANSYGTTSFSNGCESLKMWSHYADLHKGFVIIFDRDILEYDITAKNTRLENVKYDGVPKIRLDFTNDILSITDDKELLLNKLPEWNSENEVRIIRKDTFNSYYKRLLRFPKNCIIGIIYGHRMKIENIKTIDRTLWDIRDDIKFYTTHKHKERDKMVFRQIIYDYNKEHIRYTKPSN